MKINIVAICCALCVALLAASIVHQVSKNKHVAADDFQIDADQEVEVVSCYLLVDTTMRLAHTTPFYATFSPL
jgi:hypothetical protein